MRISLPILVVLCVASVGGVAALHGRADQGRAAPPRVAQPQAVSARSVEQAAAVWREASRRFAQYTVLSAEVRQQIQAFGQSLVGSGSYLQAVDRAEDPPRPLARFEVLIGSEGSYQQVCDGQRIWTVRQASGETTLRTIDLRIVERALASAGRPPEDIVAVGFALCGVPHLMHALDGSVEFNELAEGRLHDRPVWALRGQWNRDHWISLLPDQREALEKGERPRVRELPEQVPDQFVVYLGRDDLFPRRVDLRRSVPPAYAHSEQPAPRVLFSLELVNIRFEAHASPERFRFDPGAQNFEDVTAEALDRLGLKLQTDADAK